MKKKRETLEELRARLKADPEWVAARAREQAARDALRAEVARAERSLVEELRAVGYKVDSAWDLVNTAMPYPRALPILLDHLVRPYPVVVREGIARALAVPEAAFGLDVLLRQFRSEPEERAKVGLACAINVAAPPERIGEVIDLVRDPRHGAARAILLAALERSKDPRAKATLVELADEPQLKLEIGNSLRRLAKGKRPPMRRRRLPPVKI